jgi:putative DNA primase/helicase
MPEPSDGTKSNNMSGLERLDKARQKANEGRPESGSSGSDGSGCGYMLLPPPSQPVLVARRFMHDCCTREDGTTTLRYWRSGWWRWLVTHWVELSDCELRSVLYLFTESAIYMHVSSRSPLAVPEPKPWAPTRNKITDLADALSSVCFLLTDVDQPCWLDGRETGSIVATTNGLLDIERRQLYEHTPLFFNQTAVPFDYDPGAPEPERWLGFVDALWPDDPAAIDLLHEWMGYVVSGRLDLHKIFMMVGPTRGGKGVIGRILKELVGKQNYCGPTLNSLGGEFGLAPLIGKSLAIIADARFVGRDAGVVVERLLSISGEDTLTVNRKYREQWTNKLPCRLQIISNELPKLGDASEAIVGRIILLPTTISWLGREDYTLEPALQLELTGILNLALAGLRRLAVENGNRFTRVASADKAVNEMRDLASPVAAFVRECCQLGVDERVGVDELYAAYKRWAKDSEHQKVSKPHFGRDLKAAFPSIEKQRPREGSVRYQIYAGIALVDRCDHGDQEKDEPLL